jgi:hypothetical protein
VPDVRKLLIPALLFILGFALTRSCTSASAGAPPAAAVRAAGV